MSAPIKTFLIEPTEESWFALRRYYHSPDETEKCPGPMSYHNAEFDLGIQPNSFHEDKDLFDQFPKSDERWPKSCVCGYQFRDHDNWQLFENSVWVRRDTGEKISLRKAPTGAIYRATWMEDAKFKVGFDGQCWICILPGNHPWHIDGQASNCTRKGDLTHRCWIRHGTAPDFHVDKDGDTCSAGAGSIIAPNGWHGFLHHGHLVTC